MKIKKINLFGASGHAKVVLDCIESSSANAIGHIYDDDENIVELMNYKVFPSRNILDKHNFIISIGNNKIRKKIAAEGGFTFAKPIIHASANVSKNASLGEGTVVMPLAGVNSAAKIGKHVIINTAAVVEHDCELGDFTHISPNASLAGGVRIGENTHVGTGAIVLPGLHIGANCTIGAGAVVTKNIPDNCTAVGIPAKPI